MRPRDTSHESRTCHRRHRHVLTYIRGTTDRALATLWPSSEMGGDAGDGDGGERPQVACHLAGPGTLSRSSFGPLDAPTPAAAVRRHMQNARTLTLARCTQ